MTVLGKKRLKRPRKSITLNGWHLRSCLVKIWNGVLYKALKAAFLHPTLSLSSSMLVPYTFSALVPPHQLHVPLCVTLQLKRHDLLIFAFLKLEKSFLTSFQVIFSIEVKTRKDNTKKNANKKVKENFIYFGLQRVF